jgi:hypothetical protein
VHALFCWGPVGGFQSIAPQLIGCAKDDIMKALRCSPTTYFASAFGPAADQGIA